MDVALDWILGLDTRWVLAGLLLVLDIWSIWLLARARPSREEFILWSGIVLLVPVFGCLFWYALGPKPTVEPRPRGGTAVSSESERKIET